MQPTTAPTTSAPPQPWHALAVDTAVASVQSDHDVGLTTAEAQARLARVGANELPEAERRSLLGVFLGQFRSPLIYLLLVAAGIALALGHRSDAAVIFAVVVLNAVIGGLQEGRAERSLAALRQLAKHDARVLRDGGEVVVAAREVVPGDVIILEAGDAVPADARVLHGAALQIAEAPLTGESVPVAKDARPLATDTPLADRRNMVYAGTHVTAGRARAIVVTTGTSTEIGQIAALAGAATETKTPLERRIAQFGRYVIVAAVAMFAIVLAIGAVRGLPLGQVLMIGISQLVGMIPEGLPVAMTIALAVGVQRMARRRVVVRRLAAVETLGSTTVICTDKTGTLTRNEMTVTMAWLADHPEVAITGGGYAPTGDIIVDGAAVDVAPPRLRELLEAATLCNDAQLHGPEDPDHRWQAIGDPTEVALVTAAIKAGIVPTELRAQIGRRAEIPFDPAAKLMATQHHTPDGMLVIVKGAPEEVFDMCATVRRAGGDVPLDAAARDELRATTDALAAHALRLLAVAVLPNGEIDGNAGFEAFRGRLTLLGLLGQIDPPRLEVRDAVSECRAAGIRAVMVTGDHKATGYAIARELGIARDGDAAVDGRELQAMDDAELARRIDEIAVFARVHPAQKLRIVDAYQRRHEIVAMTGDGVNDAPALSKADVGVAMGITGTEVAKESAKIVIADDNFASIVAAIEEGRVVYRNLKKVVLYLFSTSLAEVVVLLLALVLGYPPPLAAVQILWINLVTEGTVTVNLIMEPAEGDEMRRPPIPPNEPLITRTLLSRLVVITPAIALVTFGWFAARIAAGVPFGQVQTETFTVLAVCQWFNVLNCRSEHRSALNLGILQNRWLIGGLIASNLLQLAVVYWRPLGDVFHTVPFGAAEFFAIGAVASLVLWVEEVRKLIARRRARSRGPEQATLAHGHARSPADRTRAPAP